MTTPNVHDATESPRQVVLKWAVPVDDQDHPIGSGPVVLVATIATTDWLASRVVYVWTLETFGDTAAGRVYRARVYGTGQPVPAGDAHLGSTVDQSSGLVWHVFGGPR